MYCQKCGSQNPDDGKFCSKCGTDLSKTNVVQPPKRKITGWQYLLIALCVIEIFGFLISVISGKPIYTELGSGILWFAIVIYLRYYRK